VDLHRTPARLRSLSLLLLALGACSDDDAEPEGDKDGEGDGTASVYALANTVATQETATTYVHLLSTLDVKEKVGSKGGREYGGYATVAAQGGGVLVASAESPTVQRFEINDDLELEDGDEVDFGDYGVMSAGFYGNVFVNETKAYMNAGQINRVIWNPKEMTIEGEAPSSGIEAQDGEWTAFAAYDRGIGVSDGKVYQPFYFHDEDFYAIKENSKIVIYGADDAVEETLDIDCPGLDTVTKDEDGNMIFSTWAGTIPYRLTSDEAAKSCAVQIDAGGTKVAKTFRFEDFTDGRETAMYKYMKDGVGTVAVYDTEGLDLDGIDDPKTLNGMANWELWRVNIEEESAEPIEGLPKFSGGYYSFTIDNRTLVLLPSADLSSTSIYEVKTTGKATKLFETTGWTYQLAKVR
jgi:hypothetical protein